MPTGYTAAIADGIDFKTFALNCTRALGVCVTLRDEPGGGEAIPERFEPSDYSLKKRADSEAELARLKAMTTEEVQAEADKHVRESEAARLEGIQRNNDLLAKYEAMLAQAKAWIPPTPEHVGLRDFMVEQITRSIDFDCDTDHLKVPIMPIGGEEFRKLRIRSLEQNIAYHTHAYEQEVERVNSRNQWIADLRASLATTQEPQA